jgi:predicted metalloprotease|tara:strand:+ start:2259 stop:2603 length:345 start_codon:yes stop_codon:yes gene_type:complete
MKINDIIIETTTAGGMATVAQPMGKMQRRPNPSIYSKKKKTTEDQVPYLQRPNSGYRKAVNDFLRMNPGKTEEDWKSLLPNQQEKYLNPHLEGKSPHKKGTKKYKKHMAAMHAG